MSDKSMPFVPPKTQTHEIKSSWWKRKVLAPITQQLTQGATPSKLALALAVGGVIAINPFLGTTTAACLAAGLLLRLNQPTLQVANVVGAPFQLGLILVWVRGGEWLYGADPMPLTPTLLLEQFRAAPWQFMKQFGSTALHAGTAWLLLAPLVGLLLYGILHPLLRLLSEKFLPKTAVSNASEP